ncbi:oligosaccharide flippase family protein [Blautia glucerasea]
MQQQNRTKSTLVNTSFAVMARVVSMVMGFIQKTIFIRTLGMSYTGVSGLFTDILTVLSLAELGISSAIAYSLYKPLADGDYRRVAQLMNFFKKAYHFIAATVFIIGLCLVPLIPYIVRDVPDITESIQLIFFLYICNTAVTYLLVYKNTLLVADQKQYIVTNIQMLFTVISIGTQCIMLKVFKQFLLYLVLQIVFSLLQNLTINYIATRKYPQLRQYSRERISKGDKNKLFKDVKALMMYKIANVVLNGTDSTIISANLGTQQVGIAGSYNMVKGYLTSFIAQFYNALNPSLGNLAATEGKQRQYAFFKKINFATFWLASFCSTSLFCLLNPFIRIWLGNENWILPLGVVAINVLEFYLSIMMHPLGAFRQANGLFVQTKYVAIVKAIINLVVSIALVKPLGILGVWLGTVVAYALSQLWYEPIVIYKEVFKRNVKSYYLTFIKYTIVTVACSASITILMERIFILDTVPDFLLRILLCLLVPNISIYLIYRKTEECKYAITAINRVIASIINRVRKGRKNKFI